MDRSKPDHVEFTAEAIYKFLSERPELRSQIAGSLVWALERPRSHPHAISLWRKMTALSYTWPEDLLRRVKAAEVSQPFVRNAYTIPSNAHTKLAGYVGSSLESESESETEPAK